jgi:hypothetical protein
MLKSKRKTAAIPIQFHLETFAISKPFGSGFGKLATEHLLKIDSADSFAYAGRTLRTPSTPFDVCKCSKPCMPFDALPFELLVGVIVLERETLSPSIACYLLSMLQFQPLHPSALSTPMPLFNRGGKRFPYVSVLALPL